MNRICACIDGSNSTACVIDWAAWCALRLNVPLELLHALENNHERAPSPDLSGSLELGSQEQLLKELTEVDARRSALALQLGDQLLASARRRALAAGAPDVHGRMRRDELSAAVMDMETNARVFVLGKHARPIESAKLHLDHHVERVIRAVKRPVLVTGTAPFQAPKSFVLAFDGSPTARNVVQVVAESALLKGLNATIVHAGEPSAETQDQLAAAEAVLAGAGYGVRTVVHRGEPEDVLPRAISEAGASLLVMGAYGHSRIRQLIVGSTTTTLLRLSAVPVLILR